MRASGGLNLLKPPGMTSHDVVGYVRKTLGERRVGHAGTLDPAAAGVLPVCFGEGTKVMQFLQSETKMYRTEIVFGYETDSQDYTGRVTSSADPSFETTIDLFVNVLNKFRGTIDQIPPMVSAIKINGQRCYDLAREGVMVDRTPRTINISDLNIVRCPDIIRPGSVAVIDVECSKGTYIRTLCDDIGRTIGCGAHMGFLLRTRVGSMCIDDSLSLEELRELGKDRILQRALSVNDLLSRYEEIRLPVDIARKVRNGMTVLSSEMGIPIRPDQTYRMADEEGNLLAVYESFSSNDSVVMRSVRGFAGSPSEGVKEID